MGKVMISGVAPKMKEPSTYILLSSLAEGSIVKLNENGSPVEFYVACHNYESALNGEGRTLLVRKDCYDTRAWHSSDVNAYATSDIDAWLNGDYKELLNADAQTEIGTTKFYYTPGNGNTTVTTLERSIFLLSVTELGKNISDGNTEGTATPISSLLQIAHLNGSDVSQWTRSPYKNDKIRAYLLFQSGSPGRANCSANQYCSRPAFTLPYNALFDKKTLVLKGGA